MTKQKKCKHYFIGLHEEFKYFIRKYQFNPHEWINLTRYDQVLGRRYKKGFVHIGESAFQIKDIDKLLNYIEMTYDKPSGE